jgi:hypothetical protein
MRKFERYSTRSGKLMVIIQVWHKTVLMADGVFSSPSSVEILDVLNESVNEITVAQFDGLIAEKKLTRITNK